MRPGQRRRSQGGRQEMLQTALPEREGLRGGVGRRHHGARQVLHQASRLGYREMRRERCGPPSTRGVLPEFKETQFEEL